MIATHLSSTGVGRRERSTPSFRGGKMRRVRCVRNLVRPEIKQFAKKMRTQPTHCEAILWDRLKGSGLCGIKFRRQHIIRGYIVDFYSHKHLIAIEVDGLSHDKKKDAVRDARVLKLGVRTIRFTNESVRNSLTQVLERIALECGKSRFPTFPQRQQQQELLRSNVKEIPVVVVSPVEKQ